MSSPSSSPQQRQQQSSQSGPDRKPASSSSQENAAKKPKPSPAIADSPRSPSSPSPLPRTQQTSTALKCRRTKLSLKRNFSETSSQSSRESLLKFEDDTQSSTSISISTAVVCGPSSVPPDYESIAAEFKINVATVKKHYSILTIKPRVPIIRTLPIKNELSPISPIHNYDRSPIFKSRQRRLRRKSQIKTEPLPSDTPGRKIINKQVGQKFQNYFETLETAKLDDKSNSSQVLKDREFSQQNGEQSQSSKSNNTSLTHKINWQLILDSSDSENEFEVFENSSISKSKVQPLSERNRTLVTNPFSKLKNKSSKKPKNSKSSQNSQTKNKTFWTKHFSSDDSISKKKEKFIRTFKKKKENESEHSDSDIAYMGCSLSKSKKNEAKAIQKQTSKTRSKQSQLSKVDSSSTESCEKSLNDSLSVNCQPLFTKNIKKIKKNNSVSSSCTQSSLPLSFGGDRSHLENHNNDEDEVKKPSTNPLSQMHSTKKSSESSHKTKNLDGNQQSSFIESSKSLGCGNISPTNSDCLSPLKEELLRASTPQPSNVKDITKSKAKPKIISDNILPNNAIILPGPQNVHKKRIQLKFSPNSLTKSNDVANSSPRSIINEIKQKASNKNASESFAKSEINGVTQSLSNVKNVSSTAINTSRGNWRSKLTLKKNSDSTSIQSTKTQSKLSLPSLDGGKVEESFESLCQDLTELSSYENVTLYKGTQNETIELKGEKVVLRLSGDNFTDTDFKLPMLLDSNEDGKESTSSKTSSRISPIIFERNRPLNRPLPSPTPTTAERNVSQLKPFTRPFQRQPSHDQTSSLRPRSATIANPQSKAGAPLPSLSKSWLLLSKDPRLNRSISPTKTVSERDPRLNRSISPTKTISERDPRLNRSMSPLTAAGVEVTDPRLIRGRSTPANESTSYTEDKIVDPRLRKRKEREEAERAAKITKEEDIGENKNDVSTQSAASEDSDNPVQAAKRRKSSIFGRLGLKKTPSPERKPTIVPNELLNIIKTRKQSPQHNASLETDDDELSLHPGAIFSSDEETNSSPRHRKFTSERSRTTEELNNQSMPIRDRLSWNVPGVNRRVPPRLAPPLIQTATSTGRFNSHQPGQVPPLMSQKIKPLKTLQHPLNAPAIKIPSANYGSGSVFTENFYKMNAAQMVQDLDNFRTQELQDNSYVTFGDNVEKTTKFDHVSMLDGPNEPVQVGMTDVKISFFRNYCFRMLRRGRCAGELTTCNFSHKVLFLRKLITQKKPDVIVCILDGAIQNDFEFFLTNVWSSVLPMLHNDAFAIYEKMYQRHIRVAPIIHGLLEYCLVSKLHTAESFIKRISPIIEKNDRDTVQIICSEIKSKLTDGFCWETIKDLCQKAIPPHDLIELTMLQCLKRKKNQSHIQEVYDLVKNRIGVLERNRLSPSLLKQFYNLVQSKDFSGATREVMNTVPLMTTTTNTANFVSSKERGQIRRPSNDSVKSIESDKLVQPLTVKTNKAYSCQIASPAKISDPDEQPNGSPVEVLKTTPNRGESTNFTEYIVTEVDSDEPTSSFRDRFWKLYHTVQGINEGLNHVDYEYVWKTMDRFCTENTEDGELVKRAYYHILCKNVKNCERHMTEIIKQAVRGGWSASRRSVDLLFDTGVCALIDLTNSNLWVMALGLLSSVKILEPDEPRTDFVLISAEIYLANNDPLEALYLLQRTKLIRTNRDEWLVKDCTRDDEVHRNKIIFILLKALSFVDIDKAAYLFKTLIDDQYISYYPIDLPLYLDKLTLLLILQDKNDLVADISRLVMDNDLTFQKSTYQELLIHTLPFDEVLANQILDYAIHLGYYNDIQIRNGFTTIILDSNSTEEEVYLILKRLIRKLLLSVGPVVYRLKPNQLKVIMIFEDIPSEKRLHRNELAVMTRDKYKDFRNLVVKLLATRFSPPIRIALQRHKGNRFCKIISRSLVEYLKHWI